VFSIDTITALSLPCSQQKVTKKIFWITQVADPWNQDRIRRFAEHLAEIKDIKWKLAKKQSDRERDGSCELMKDQVRLELQKKVFG